MATATAFDAFTKRYDQWFESHRAEYCSELLALRAQLPLDGLGVEIGVGTGRFAGPLGVPVGIDPSLTMLEGARRRGVNVAVAVAEALPFRAGTFDFALIVTTICFVDDVRAMFAETWRVLKRNGRLVVGFIDRESPLGKHYREHQEESVFYREASFYSGDEVASLLKESGFGKELWMQTLTRPRDMTPEVEPTGLGRGRGSFVVVGASKRGG